VTCVTCEVTPPPEKLSPTPVHEGHIGVRFAPIGLGWCILYRGRDVTDQTVEALAGDEDSGWVELRPVRESDGAPIIHGPGPVEALRCPSCGTEWAVTGEPVTDVDLSEAVCVDCPAQLGPVRAYKAHAMTVIRPGEVRILRGAELLTGRPVVEATGLGEVEPSYLPAEA